MIHYHGGPITPESAARKTWTARHAMISFANPDQLPLAAEICQSFALDNGTFSAWRAGREYIPGDFVRWVRHWRWHPGFDWALIPDVIDGTVEQNDEFLTQWPSDLSFFGVPVWHLHEPLDRLAGLCTRYPRVAFGSSGKYAVVGNAEWHSRMVEAMQAICDEDGHPKAKLHGLRMLNPSIFSRYPFSSADSTNVARNVGIDRAWFGTYLPASKACRAAVLVERIESHASAHAWFKQSRYHTHPYPELLE